jgi:1-acyl-sn-glycerol-3-phosphate acyltransferase
MSLVSPLLLSKQLLATFGTQTFFHYQDRVPQGSRLLLISNHRSFMDAPLLMTTVNHSVRFACHRYMANVPLLNDFVARLGCFPLDAPDQRQHHFFHRAVRFLQNREMVGIFPEGTQPMVSVTSPAKVGTFQRGFAHLALRSPVQDLAVLPVAIASQDEFSSSLFPVKLLSWFDASEPLFQQSGWHPLVIYQRVNVLVGRPIWITESYRQSYQGKQARTVITELTEHCHSEICDLLHRGF